MTRSDDALAGYWDRQAATYDARMSGVERRLFAPSRQWVCARARGTTLDVAVGTGANLRHYPADVVLTGVDWSRAMLGEAGREARRLGRAVDLRRGDAAALPFPARSFDTVVCTYALCCIPDPLGALREAVRALRPGGRLLLADHVAASFWPLRALQHLVDLVTGPLQGEYYTRRPMTALRTLDVEVVATDRLALGTIERVHALVPA